MFIEKCEVVCSTELKRGTFLIEVRSTQIAGYAKPGQFCNLKVRDTNFPLLRRPFSFCDVEGDSLYFMIYVHGEGTKILTEKRPGDIIDVFGPMGGGFNIDGDFDTALLVAGGIGVAPFPFLAKKMKAKKIISFIGGRTSDNIIEYGLKDSLIATEDGSLGMKGNVIDLLKSRLEIIKSEKLKMFSCGPNPMFRALKEFTEEHNIPCEISTESAMACGFGICQGCPVELTGGGYKLICKDGPVFNIKEVKI